MQTVLKGDNGQKPRMFEFVLNSPAPFNEVLLRTARYARRNVINRETGWHVLVVIVFFGLQKLPISPSPKDSLRFKFRMQSDVSPFEHIRESEVTRVIIRLRT